MNGSVINVVAMADSKGSNLEWLIPAIIISDYYGLCKC